MKHKKQPYCVVATRTGTVISRHKSRELAERKWKRLYGYRPYFQDVSIEKRHG